MKSILDAIILAGGKGKRMRTVTMDKIPKGLTPIQEVPILNWELQWLAREGIKHVILAVGHLSDKIQETFGSTFESSYGSVEISYSIEDKKLGSGGAIKLASELISSDRCLIMNGDILVNSSLDKMRSIHENQNALATMLLVKMRSPYGIVHTEGSMIKQFIEKPILDIYIHGGVDIINAEIFERFPEVGQMEDTIFVDLVMENKFASFKISEKDFWMSIDSEKDYETANKNWRGF